MDWTTLWCGMALGICIISAIIDIALLVETRERKKK